MALASDGAVPDPATGGCPWRGKNAGLPLASTTSLPQDVKPTKCLKNKGRNGRERAQTGGVRQAA